MARDMFEDFLDDDFPIIRLTERQAELVTSIRFKLASVERDVREMKRSLHAAARMRRVSSVSLPPRSARML